MTSYTMFDFQATIRLRSNGKSPASRHFITLPKKISEEIKKIAAALPRKGRGSVKIKARIGFLDRETSIFPDKKRNAFILPIKSDIRKKLQIQEGSDVYITITLI